MMENTKTELGEIKIHERVFSSIATEATRQIPGVMRIGGNFRTALLELFGIKNRTAIAIEFDKNNEVTIAIPLIVKYSYNIPEVAKQVQDSVRLNIETATNITVKNININVQTIEKEAT